MLFRKYCNSYHVFIQLMLLFRSCCYSDHVVIQILLLLRKYVAGWKMLLLENVDKKMLLLENVVKKMLLRKCCNQENDVVHKTFVLFLENVGVQKMQFSDVVVQKMLLRKCCGRENLGKCCSFLENFVQKICQFTKFCC